MNFFKSLVGWRPQFVPRRQFERIFKFVPSEKGRIRGLEQMEVDDKLSSLTQKAESLYQEEEKLYALANRYGECRSPLTVRKSILELRPKLEAAKCEFWLAHRLAKHFGFKVEEDVRAYYVEMEKRAREDGTFKFTPQPVPSARSMRS